MGNNNVTKYSKKDVIEKTYDNGKTYIEIKDTFICIKDSKTNERPGNAIKITPGFEIELGRSIKEFKSALPVTRLPITLKEVTTIGNKSVYDLLRLGTGKVKTKTIASIKCENNLITGVSFNRDLLKDTEFKKYCKLSVLHQIAMPRETLVNSDGLRIKTILNTLFPGSHDIDMQELKNNVVIKFTVHGQTLALRFIYIPGTKDICILSGVMLLGN